jgi:AcrR family transcriptional regulator
MADVKRRAYVSPLRHEQAATSRAAVLAAARDLFLAQGYGATTIEQIATRAGVSKPTVFSAVGNKAALLKTVRDVAMAGDDEARTVTQRDTVAAIATAPDLKHAISAVAAHIAIVTERYHGIHAVLLGAAGVDREMADLWETAESQRLVGAGHLLDRLVVHGRTAATRRRAQDLLWLLMAPDHYTRLVVERGWSVADYRRWLRDTIRSQVF